MPLVGDDAGVDERHGGAATRHHVDRCRLTLDRVGEIALDGVHDDDHGHRAGAASVVARARLANRAHVEARALERREMLVDRVRTVRELDRPAVGGRETCAASPRSPTTGWKSE